MKGIKMKKAILVAMVVSVSLFGISGELEGEGGYGAQIEDSIIQNKVKKGDIDVKGGENRVVTGKISVRGSKLRNSRITNEVNAKIRVKGLKHDVETGVVDIGGGYGKVRGKVKTGWFK
jgi:hypothetical protein